MAIRSAFWPLLVAAVLVASPSAPLAEVLTFTVYAPNAERFDLALDEIELDWSQVPGAKRTDFRNTVVAVPRSSIVETGASGAVFSATAANAADLLTIVAALEIANPGAEAQLVVYESGRARTLATRRLLTREIALILTDAIPVGDVIGLLRIQRVRPVPGIPNSFVLEVADPLAAPAIADALRERDSVKYAYPLLRRHLRAR